MWFIDTSSVRAILLCVDNEKLTCFTCLYMWPTNYILSSNVSYFILKCMLTCLLANLYNTHTHIVQLNKHKYNYVTHSKLICPLNYRSPVNYSNTPPIWLAYNCWKLLWWCDWWLLASITTSCCKMDYHINSIYDWFSTILYSYSSQ